MKVLQINSVCGIGSTGRIATDLYHILKEQGHECKIGYGRDEAKNISTEDIIKIGTNFDVNVHALMTRITDRAGFYSRKATRTFIEKIKEYDPDVIHLHNIHGYYINIEMLFNYLAESNKPVVWTLHDCWAFTGHCSHFDFVNCSQWETGCFRCPQKGEYPRSVFIDKSRQNYQKKKSLFTSVENMVIITPSRWLSHLVGKSFLNKYEVKVIPNGIDLDTFKPTKSDFRRQYNLENRKIVLGVASAWGARKGLQDFVKLSSLLDNNYKIVLVGLSKKQIKDLPTNIIGIARTNSVVELAALYTMANVFVNPTYEDNFPTTNLEALACGTPVVTYNTGGSPESIDETCGIVIPKGDVESLYKAICQIENNPLNEAMIIEKACCFDKFISFAEYIELYKVIT